MGRGERREEEEEGVVMSTDFFWSYTDEPHASRRREILSKYPQIKELFGPDHWAFHKITVAVLLQLGTAALLQNAGWTKILLISYFFGSFLNHNLFLAIHELSHNLAFSTPVLNRWLGIFANLPIGVPMSVTFQKYHLEHHRFQGVDGVDMDVPSLIEGRVVTNIFAKTIWVFLQLFFYALRPMFLKPKPPGWWEFINFAIQIALDVAMVHYFGWKSFAYLILSTFVGGGMHPMAGHFISEHYVFKPDQETYSYYGPLNPTISRESNAKSSTTAPVAAVLTGRQVRCYLAVLTDLIPVSGEQKEKSPTRIAIAAVRSPTISRESKAKSATAAAVAAVLTGRQVRCYLARELSNQELKIVHKNAPHEPSALDMTESLLGLGWKSARLLC